MVIGVGCYDWGREKSSYDNEATLNCGVGSLNSATNVKHLFGKLQIFTPACNLCPPDAESERSRI